MAEVSTQFTQVAAAPVPFDTVAAGKAFLQEFPEMKDQVFFFDFEGNGRIFGPETAKLQKLREWIATKVKEGSELRDDLEEAEKHKISLCSLQDDSAVVIYYARDEYTPILAQFIFDHEVGHALARTSVDYRNESYADAYALIRYLQRGAEDPAVLGFVEGLSRKMFFEKDALHFTTAVTDQILAQKDSIDWKSLTPQDAWKKACEFVNKYKMSPAAINNMMAEFDTLRLAGWKEAWQVQSSMQQLAGLLMKTPNKDVFKYGYRMLKWVGEDMGWKELLPQEAWDELKPREKHFARSKTDWDWTKRHA